MEEQNIDYEKKEQLKQIESPQKRIKPYIRTKTIDLSPKTDQKEEQMQEQKEEFKQEQKDELKEEQQEKEKKEEKQQQLILQIPQVNILKPQESSNSEDNNSDQNSQNSKNDELELLMLKSEASPFIEWKFEWKQIENKKQFEISIGSKVYEIDLEDENTQQLLGENMKFQTIINNLEPLKTLFIGKQTKQYAEISKITKHWHYTSLQSYFDHLQLLLLYRQKVPAAMIPPEDEADKCCICLEELYPGILNFTMDEILKQLEEQNEEKDVVQFQRCDGHGFHVICLKQFINGQDWVKCPVCMKIYGVMTGDQPEGTMEVHINKHQDCDGYPGKGTIIINYNMQGGENSKCKYPPTHRIAYMPNIEESQQVVKLLRKCFKRKLMFTIGTSVTTGRNNVIVWNGIHHKTRTWGGSSHYGWPDPTYFNRVKFELAAKGIY